MQKRLFVLAIAAIFTSCTQPKDNTTDNGKPVANVNQHNVEQIDLGDVVPIDTADAWIKRYHKALREAGQPDIGLSFMLDANVLRTYLNEHTDITKLDVYLAKPNDTAITVVYIPAVDTVDGDSVKYVERPVSLPGSTAEYALDHAMPCPVCAERIKLPGNAITQ